MTRFFTIGALVLALSAGPSFAEGSAPATVKPYALSFVDKDGSAVEKRGHHGNRNACGRNRGDREGSEGARRDNCGHGDGRAHLGRDPDNMHGRGQ